MERRSTHLIFFCKVLPAVCRFSLVFHKQLQLPTQELGLRIGQLSCYYSVVGNEIGIDRFKALLPK